jgi:hypothetical protein
VCPISCASQPTMQDNKRKALVSFPHEVTHTNLLTTHKQHVKKKLTQNNPIPKKLSMQKIMIICSFINSKKTVTTNKYLCCLNLMKPGFYLIYILLNTRLLRLLRLLRQPHIAEDHVLGAVVFFLVASINQ